MRIFRKNQQQKAWEGKLESLRHVKSDVKEMAAGQECGISSKTYNAFEVGDRIQSIVMEQIKRTIDG